LASCGGKVASAVALLVADGFFTLAIDKPIKKGKVEIKCSLKNNKNINKKWSKHNLPEFTRFMLFNKI
jgi:hypothetical protein